MLQHPRQTLKWLSAVQRERNAGARDANRRLPLRAQRVLPQRHPLRRHLSVVLPPQKVPDAELFSGQREELHLRLRRGHRHLVHDPDRLPAWCRHPQAQRSSRAQADMVKLAYFDHRHLSITESSER